MRKIIHCDCDCFYAAVETRDQPELRGKPIAVGGSSERRGVIATCNYEARRFGIHSAMPTATALRLCPQLIILPPDMGKYRRVSADIHRIFRDYTDLIEPLSLDEAYLDVSASTAAKALACKGSATLIAQDIRQRVREQLGITLSAGIAPNKFLAKIASDWNKPDGQFVIRPEEVDAFVKDLPVKKLFGVGKVTATKLHNMGIRTCQDLRTHEEQALLEHFGSFGSRLYRLSRGIDEREVSSNRIRKSLSVENTYAQDLPTLQACLQELPNLHEQMQQRLSPLSKRYRVSKQFVKLRFNDFVSTTAEHVAATSDYTRYPDLLKQAWPRGNKPVRLIGIGVKLEPLDAPQMSLFGEEGGVERGDGGGVVENVRG